MDVQDVMGLCVPDDMRSFGIEVNDLVPTISH